MTGDNFGCGSSREHAPWALVQSGIHAVISTSFADIFKGNALKNQLLPVVVPADAHAELLKSPWATVKIDLVAQTVTLPSGRVVEFPIDAFAKTCLVEGVDELGYMLQQEPAIAAFEAKRVGSVNTSAVTSQESLGGTSHANVTESDHSERNLRTPWFGTELLSPR